MDIAKGLLGRHYRLGWKEKQNAGKSLIEEQHPDGLRPSLDVRMPEGQHEPVYQPMQVVPNQKVDNTESCDNGLCTKSNNSSGSRAIPKSGLKH